MNIASHSVNISINGEKCRMVISTRNLLDEDREQNRDWRLILFIFVDIPSTRLPIGVRSDEIEFVNVHLKYN